MRSPFKLLLELFEFIIRGDLLYLTGKHRCLDKLNRVTHGCLLYILVYNVHHPPSSGKPLSVPSDVTESDHENGLLASPAVTAVPAALRAC